MKSRNQRIQYKITVAILMTSTAVLLLTGLAYLTYEYFAFRRTTLNRIESLAKVISNNCTASLAFDAQDDAYEVLSALRAEEHMVAAVLYDEAGNLFSKYTKDQNDQSLPQKAGKERFNFTGSYLQGFQPVILGSKQIGTLYLRYDLMTLHRQYLFYGLIALAIFFLSLLLAYFLSSRMQKKISNPIISLADFARAISVHKNFSVRATKQSEDEIGILTDSFNQMLAQIEQQNQALNESEKNFRTLADNIPNLCSMADPEGKIFWFNKRWYEYTGVTPELMKEGGWPLVLAPGVLAEVSNRWTESIKTGEPFEMVFPIKGADNIFRPFLTRVNPVKDSEGNIVRWFGTNTDITEQIKAEETLERKNMELTRINNDLDNFIYTASHDLKSPVSNLEGLLNLISDEKEGLVTEKARDVLPMVSQSVIRLKTVIKELTEIARIQKDIDKDSEKIVLDEICKEVLELCEKELKAFSGKVICDFEKAPKIKFSRKNLRSILYNLISNALKYSSPDREGLVEVKTEIQDHYIVLSVCDNGLGIPENQSEKIFTMFKRYHTHVEGSGVGLYIVKRMIENAGGKITLESKEGVGSTFKVYFKK